MITSDVELAKMWNGLWINTDAGAVAEQTANPRTTSKTIGYKKSLLGKIQEGIRFKIPIMADHLTVNRPMNDPPYRTSSKLLIV